MRIRMLESRPGSPDGVRIVRYPAGLEVSVGPGDGDTPPLTESLRATFVRERWAEPIPEAGGAADAGGEPEPVPARQPGDVVCPACGTPTHYALHEGKCWKCGADLPEPERAVETPEHPEERETKPAPKPRRKS